MKLVPNPTLSQTFVVACKSTYVSDHGRIGTLFNLYILLDIRKSFYSCLYLRYGMMSKTKVGTVRAITLAAYCFHWPCQKTPVSLLYGKYLSFM